MKITFCNALFFDEIFWWGDLNFNEQSMTLCIMRKCLTSTTRYNICVSCCIGGIFGSRHFKWIAKISYKQHHIVQCIYYVVLTSHSEYLKQLENLIDFDFKHFVNYNQLVWSRYITSPTFRIWNYPVKNMQLC